MGKLLGTLRGMSAVDLGAHSIRAALERSGVPPADVEYTIMGHVLQAGTGQITARQAAVRAGVPMSVPAVTVNKVCLSGLDAVVLADQLIRAGEYEVVVAGGMESMTQAPHLLPGSRAGTKYGDTALVDSMERDGLWDSFTTGLMGALTDQVNEDSYGFTRAQQDAYAARSHQLAAKAQQDGTFGTEIAPVSVPQRKSDPLLIDTDEGVRPDSTADGLAKLPPAFGSDGTITAASASPISDGGCALVVMSKRRAEEQGLDWIAEIGPAATVAGPDSSLQVQPANAIRAACTKAGVDASALDLVEINEAFAAVALASVRELGLDDARVNAAGGALALGHPLGMSGARLALHLALALRNRGGGVGAAALCGGGGQGQALVLRSA